MSGAVDFNTIKQQVDMERLLDFYGLLAGMRSSASGLRGCCPFHDDSDPSFTTTPSQQGFHCFGCGVKGNVITFVRLKETISTGDVDEDDREAARRIQTWFGLGRVHQDGSRPRQLATPTQAKSEQSEQTAPGQPLSNPPLAFQLDHLDQAHPYLASRGLSPETVRQFGIGYYPRRGSMKGRVVIPIHNAQGQLVAYVGRWPEETSPEGEPKYKLPRGFHKSLELFNLHRVSTEAKRVVLVEGYWSVFHLHQAGFSEVVALMGSTLSEIQCCQLGDRFDRVQVFMDGDRAGRAASETIVAQLAPHVWVKVAVCPEGCQPDHLAVDQLRGLLREPGRSRS